MMTQIEAERIAAALHALRPDWPTASLMKFLADRKDRPVTDLLVQLVIVARDPETKTPARVDQDGPWKRAMAAPAPEVNTSAHIRGVSPTDCDICSQPRHRCELDDSHEYRQRNRPTERASTETINRVRGYVLASNWKSTTTEDEA